MKTAYDKIRETRGYPVPEGRLRIRTIDMHTAGEPLRVIIDGVPELPQSPVLEQRDYVSKKHDRLRKLLMFEPRGHADMYGLLPVPPEREDSDFGVLFMHNAGFSTMCGHATLAIARLAVELGWVEVTEPETTLRMDAPCGQLEAVVSVENNRTTAVRFTNVPSFVVALDEMVDVPQLGEVTYDLAYGGAFYAYVDARQLGLRLDPSNYVDLIRAGRLIKRAVIEQKSNVVHPFEPDLSFLYGTIFIDKPAGEGADSRNVCIFADGEVDRSPTGSGVSGRVAIHYARDELTAGEEMVIESILGSRMTVSFTETQEFGPYTAVVPEVKGDAFVTGQHEFFLDPDDPFPEGFILR